MLLDEPEAHLDAGRRERLEEIVRTFEGAVVIASQNRYLLDRIADGIVEVSEGEVHRHTGGYSDWRMKASRPAAFGS